MIALAKPAAAELVTDTGAVIDRTGLAHPILGYVLIEPHGADQLTVRAAGSAAHGAWTIHSEDHGLTAPLAIQHAHLAKLQSLMPDGTALRIQPTAAGTVRIELTRGDANLGSWNVPVASVSTAAHFPPEPTLSAPGGDPQTFRSADLAGALAAVAWLTTDDGTVQLIGGATVVASSWSAAHRVLMPHRPLYDDLTVLPGRAAKVLRTVLPRDARSSITWDTDDTTHHLTYPGARLHLARSTAAVENVLARFFATANTPEVTAASGWLAKAVARASALSDHVELATEDEAIVARASDGSSQARVKASIHGAGWPLPVRFSGSDLASALGTFGGENIHIETAARTGTIVFSDTDGTEAVSLVPLATVDLP